MLKLTLDEFLKEVTDEIMCYEELGPEKAEEWLKHFKAVMGQSKRVKEKNGNMVVHIKDETEIFKIVDDYLAASIMEETDKYFASL